MHYIWPEHSSINFLEGCLPGIPTTTQAAPAAQGPSTMWSVLAQHAPHSALGSLRRGVTDPPRPFPTECQSLLMDCMQLTGLQLDSPDIVQMCTKDGLAIPKPCHINICPASSWNPPTKGIPATFLDSWFHCPPVLTSRKRFLRCDLHLLCYKLNLSPWVLPSVAAESNVTPSFLQRLPNIWKLLLCPPLISFLHSLSTFLYTACFPIFLSSLSLASRLFSNFSVFVL